MIASTRNPLVKQLRQLGASSKERKQQQLFLIEGTHALTEAIATSYPLSIVCHTESWAVLNPQLYAQLQSQAELQTDRQGLRLELVSEEVLAAIATTVNPDGAIAVAPIPVNATSSRIQTLGVVLETIQDPGNLGATIRSAVAVGIDGLLVSQDSVDLTHPKIIRATAGQWFRCPMQSVRDLPTEVQKLQAQGMKAIATLPNASTAYWDYDFTQPSLILLGNEGKGLSRELIDLADEAVTIPLNNHVESLNVAICGSLLLYEAYRQRRSQGIWGRQV
ncbi:RNA methyltransferase [Tumidithrix elongata RA019]|uniref:RNA methyltransferase n=1 Tax=Tumidithrix elongata BACA0141 TaxID=2716417 RepID=A0AAW9Q4Q6_9CYAN|nr:RNA methyltransferase [Tumidithrix elongata RA019]